MFNPKINNIMKKILLALAATALCFSCAKDQTCDLAPTAPDRLSVSFADETKIQLNDAMQTVWNADDRVSVFYYTDANDCWRFTGNTCDKSGDLVREMQNSASATIGKAVIVYPYSADYTLNAEKQTISADIPAVQYYTADSYGIGSNIMVSTGTSDSFVLKNLCGWLKLQLSGTKTVSSITLKGNNGERLSGRAVIDYETPRLVMGDGSALDDSEVGGTLVFDEERVLTLDCGSGVALSETPAAFYFTLAPQTFANGITMIVTYSDGTTFEKSTANQIEITRNHITPMAQLADEEEKFKIDVEFVTATFDSYTVRIIPNNSTGTYMHRAVRVSDNISEEDIIASFVASAKGTANTYYSLDYGKGTHTISPVDSDTDYIFYILGINEDGSITTPLVNVHFKTPPFVPTDNCIFTLSASAITATSMTVNIVPSSQATRYYVGLAIPKYLSDQSLEQKASIIISNGNYDNVDWTTTDLLHNGVQSLDILRDLGYSWGLADTEYIFYVFGVNANGERSTAITTLTQKTASPTPSDMTIDISLTSISMNSATIAALPSSQSEKYFFDVMEYETYINSFDNDINKIASIYGADMYSYIYQGDASLTYRLSPSTKYIAFAFGFDGGATTPLFTKEFTTEPAPAGNGVILNYEIYDGAIYGDDYKDKAIVGIYMTPYADTANWYSGWSSTPIDDFSDAELTDALLNNGGQNQTQRFYAWNWGETLYYATLAIDKDGNAGTPQRYTIAVPQKPDTATQSAVPALSSVKRLNMTATVYAPKVEIQLLDRDTLHRLK